MSSLLSLIAAVTIAAPAAFGQTQPASGAPATTPEAAAAIQALQRVCLPLLEGARLGGLAASAGLKNDNGQWVLPVENKAEITFFPPDTINPHVCTATMVHAPDQDTAIFQAISAWVKSQTPPLQPDKVQQQSNGVGHLQVLSTWWGKTGRGEENVILNQAKPLPGQPPGNQDQTTLMVSLTPT